MKKLYTIIALLLCFTAQAQKVEWVKNIGNSDNDQALRCKADNNGNLLYTGTFTNSINFGNNIELKGNGGTDAFLAKTDASGNTIWARALKSTRKSRVVDGRAMATDNEGNIYLAGTFVDTLYVDDQTLFGVKETPTTKDIFIAKYNSAGTLLLVKLLSGPGTDIIEDVEVSGDRLVVTGFYNSSLTIGDKTFHSEDPNNPSLTNNPYVAVLDLNCQPLWIDKIDCTSGFCRALSISPNGKVNLLVEMKGSPVIKTVGSAYQQAIKQSDNNSVDDYIIQLNLADGSLVWANRLGSLGAEMGYAITSDASNNIFLGGMYQQTVKLESTDGKYKSATSKGLFDIFVCKYNALGQLQWATFEGDIKTDGIRDIAVSTSGNVYVAGYFIDQTKVGNLIFTSATPSPNIQAYLAKYSPDGIFKWAETAPAANNTSYFTTLFATPNNKILLVGYFKGDGVFLDKTALANPIVVEATTNIWLSLISDNDGSTGIFTAPKDINLSVFPTPADDQINIRIDADQRIRRTRIFNCLGSTVFDNSNGKLTIPVSNLKMGVYLLEVVTNKGQSTQQVIISR